MEVEARPGTNGADRRPFPGLPWTGVALLLVALIAAFTFRTVLRAGPTAFVPSSTTPPRAPLQQADVAFETWLVARNARVIAREPWRLFDTEHCAPAEKTLTLGVPMVAMGILAAPVSLATSNPAVAYDVAIALILLISGLAMFLLVREWTGVPAAGLVAAILYAFSPARIGSQINHPSVWDGSWLVLVLFFARRLFAHGRFRDAVGLSLACSMQLAASFYPFLGAVFLAPAFISWLLARYGLRAVRRYQLAFVVAFVSTAAALVYGPFLAARNAPGALARSAGEFYFAGASEYLPGGLLFFGWGTLALAAIGLWGRRTPPPAIAGDPRWPLFGGALFVAAVASGSYPGEALRVIWPSAPFAIPNLYALLASFLPGLDAIRVVMRLCVAANVVFCILAGYGAARLIAAAGRARNALAFALVSLAALAVAWQSPTWEPLEVRVAQPTIDFFSSLAEAGNEGPILELPIVRGASRIAIDPHRILASAYHRRRTSACFGSYAPADAAAVASLADELPKASAARRLRKLGFTTVVVHHDGPFGERVRSEFAKGVAEHGRDTMTLIRATPDRTAYALRP